ncbi:MAG: dihydroorotase [Gammaproteobacteria bacterium]|nr:dihydroorotase [Gammaproteobacteria bacterium]
MIKTIEIKRPDDWHVHLRDGAMLTQVVADTAAEFARALVMPNLNPPVTTARSAAAYRDRILAALPHPADFTPLMTCYLTDNTDADDLAAGFADGIFTAAKLYPAGATFQSDRGVTSIENIMPVLERMEDIGMPLCVHGEVVDADVDIFDREAVFIEEVMLPLRNSLQGLRIVFEHITTAEAVDYVFSEDTGLAATITAHHLMINRNAIFQGGIRPHRYCLPVAKREQHRQALRRAATSGDHRFFLGTDTAPHADNAKEAACGCAGIYTAPVAMACYAQVFDQENALDRLEGFASIHGATFYRLPVNAGTLILQQSATAVDETARCHGGDIPLTVFQPPEGLFWQLA